MRNFLRFLVSRSKAPLILRVSVLIVLVVILPEFFHLPYNSLYPSSIICVMAIIYELIIYFSEIIHGVPLSISVDKIVPEELQILRSKLLKPLQVMVNERFAKALNYNA